VLAALLVLTLAWAIWSTLEWRAERRLSASARAAWSPELSAVWSPFVDTDRPMLLAVTSPLFANIQGFVFFRNTSLNNWADFENDPKLTSVRRALGEPAVFHIGFIREWETPPHYFFWGNSSVRARIISASPERRIYPGSSFLRIMLFS
jgi:hypothetical protein